MPGFEIFDQREIDAVADVINRKMVHRYSFVNSRDQIYRTEEFENAVAQKFGAKHCLAVSNGSAALFVAMKTLGLEPGDEVITTPFTFIASIEALIECGLVPVFSEIDESLNLDPKCLQDNITERTRAIMPVHMFGGAADVDEIGSVCTENGLMMFEDACQAMGASYKGKFAGTFGKFGTFSLDPYKVLTVGEGGLILTDDDEYYHAMEYYHDHGHIHSKTIERGAEGKACLGFNFRMSEIQGAIGLVQLAKLDKALAQMKSNRDAIIKGVGKIDGLKIRQCADPDGETALDIIYILPDAESAKKFQAASQKAGMGCGLLVNNTWHYARHWDTLRAYAAKKIARGASDGELAFPLYRPIEWPRTQDILSRTVAFGIDICMDKKKIDTAVKAIKAGAKAAL